MTDILQDERLKEECGVLGVFAPGQEASRIAFFGLFALQHRGQEAAGIAVSNGKRVKLYKGLGLVNAVFTPEILADLPGTMGVGHTRYSTTGASNLPNAQPVSCLSAVGEIAVAHNGNLVNSIELRDELIASGEHFVSTTDSEVIARMLARNLDQGPEYAVKEVMRRVKGAYAVTVLTPKYLIGFRDPSGIRPLVAGTIKSANPEIKDGFYLASETCAFGPVGATPTHWLDAGEMVVIDDSGMRFSQGHPKEPGGMCLFEFIYFARPDSKMHNTSLYSARERMGIQLAVEHPVDADVVMPVPDSGIPAALGFARQSGLEFREGMTKSRYIQRTFISPDQRLRELGVRMKLTPLDEHIEGKRIVLVDDSIVRGTTTRQIVKMMFEAGAKEVHVRITAPPIKHPCFYGIDMPSRKDLASANMNVEELTEQLGANSLGFLSVEGAVLAVNKDPNRYQYCKACFTGEYPIPVPEALTKSALETPPDNGHFSIAGPEQPRLIED